MWAAIALGVCAGFLPHNLYPARVFMGDGGALLLGALMAAATMSVGGRSVVEFSGQAFFFYAPLFIPLVILGVPVLDTLFAIVRRTVGRRGFAGGRPRSSAPSPDAPGPRPPSGGDRAVAVDGAAVGVRAVPDLHRSRRRIVPAGIAALALVLYTVFHPRFGREAVEVDEEELDRLRRL